MYLPYLMLGYAAAALLLLAGLEAGMRAVPGLGGLRLLRWALVCGVFGTLLASLRSRAPDWISLVGGNGALIVAILLIYFATARALGVKPRFRRLSIAAAVVAIGGLAWFDYGQPNLLVRVFLSSGVHVLYAVFTAAVLFGYRERPEELRASGWSMRSQTHAVGWLQIGNVVNHGVRCVLSLLFPPVSYVHMDLIQAGFTYVNMLLNVAACCGIIWIALSLQRRGLQHAARTDSLTGLLNRRALEEILADELRNRVGAQDSIAVLLLDIDHFKAVNDAWGHPAGDEVIRRVAATLRHSMRPWDTMCRLGGEEFVALINDADLSHSEKIAARLRADVAALTGLPGGMRLTVSVGVVGSRPGESAEELLSRCDAALYQSKREGRDRVTVDRSPGVASFSQRRPGLSNPGC